MLPLKFRFIWPSGFRGEDFKISANQKQELPVVAMFGKKLFSSFEVPIIKFRSLQNLSLPFPNDKFIQNVAQSGLSNYVQNKVY